MSHELKITHRHLPHWTINDSIYFVTFCSSDTMFDENERRIILEHIKEGNDKFYDCFAAIVMPDHVHVLLHPEEGMTLSRIMHGMKGVSAHKINLYRNTKGIIWQDESYDRIVRDGNEFDVKLNYIYIIIQSKKDYQKIQIITLDGITTKINAGRTFIPECPIFKKPLNNFFS